MSKVLVCYVNPFDATAQIAMTIAEQLCRHGYYVDLRPVHRVASVRHYCGAVVGGALSVTEWDFGAVQLPHRCVRDHPGVLALSHLVRGRSVHTGRPVARRRSWGLEAGGF